MCVFFPPPVFFPNAKHRAAVPLTLKGTLLVLAPSLFVLDATSFKRENLPPQSVTWFRWSRCSFGTGHLGDIRDSHVFSARQNTLNENNWTCVNEDFQLERMKTCHIYIYILYLPSWERIHIPYRGTFVSMMFLFPRWDMLVPWRVYTHSFLPFNVFLFTVLLSSDRLYSP